MSNIDTNLKYADTHEWVRREDNGIVTVGVSDHAQALLGELVYVELPEVDQEIAAGEEAGVVESVKAASDFYAPVAGTVVEVNETLEAEPGLVNSDPYGSGWIFKLAIMDENEIDALHDADAYQTLIEEE